MNPNSPVRPVGGLKSIGIGPVTPAHKSRTLDKELTTHSGNNESRVRSRSISFSFGADPIEIFSANTEGAGTTPGCLHSIPIPAAQVSLTNTNPTDKGKADVATDKPMPARGLFYHSPKQLVANHEPSPPVEDGFKPYSPLPPDFTPPHKAIDWEAHIADAKYYHPINPSSDYSSFHLLTGFEDIVQHQRAQEKDADSNRLDVSRVHPETMAKNRYVGFGARPAQEQVEIGDEFYESFNDEDFEHAAGQDCDSLDWSNDKDINVGSESMEQHQAPVLPEEYAAVATRTEGGMVASSNVDMLPGIEMEEEDAVEEEEEEENQDEVNIADAFRESESESSESYDDDSGEDPTYKPEKEDTTYNPKKEKFTAKRTADPKRAKSRSPRSSPFTTTVAPSPATTPASRKRVRLPPVPHVTPSADEADDEVGKEDERIVFKPTKKPLGAGRRKVSLQQLDPDSSFEKAVEEKNRENAGGRGRGRGASGGRGREKDMSKK